MLYIEKIETDFINTELRVGKRAPLHCTAPGIAMLAGLSQSWVSSILEKCVPLEAFTEKTTVTVYHGRLYYGCLCSTIPEIQGITGFS